jgi:hypothetical protein
MSIIIVIYIIYLLLYLYVYINTPWREFPTELYRPNRRLSAKIVPAFADRGWHVVSVTDPYGRILEILGGRRYFFFQVAPKLYSRGWVDPVYYLYVYFGRTGIVN